MIDKYTCTNFEDEEENKKYISDNVLFHHDTLPMGEFAIGTNTTAYRMARVRYRSKDAYSHSREDRTALCGG